MRLLLQTVLVHFFVSCVAAADLVRDDWCTNKPKSGIHPLKTDCVLANEVHVDGQLTLYGLLKNDGTLPKIYRSSVSTEKHRLFSLTPKDKLTIHRVELSGGYGEGDGGGAVLAVGSASDPKNIPSFVAIDSMIRGNFGATGGGATIKEGLGEFINTTIASNEAGSRGWGGGVFCTGTETVCKWSGRSTRVELNTAGGHGAGVSCEDGAHCFFQGAIVQQNSATGFGGGVVCYGHSGHTLCSFTDGAVIQKNTATTEPALNEVVCRYNANTNLYGTCTTDATAYSHFCGVGEFGNSLPLVLPNSSAKTTSSSRRRLDMQTNEERVMVGDEDKCVNGVKDRNEADVDCGEDCFQLCQEQQECNSDYDCESGICEAREKGSRKTCLKALENYRLLGSSGPAGAVKANCTSCPSGKFGIRRGTLMEANACPYTSLTCPVGYYCLPGTSVAMPCPAGRWGATAGATSLSGGCKACSSGKFGSVMAAISESEGCSGACSARQSPQGAGLTKETYACYACPVGKNAKNVNSQVQCISGGTFELSAVNKISLGWALYLPTVITMIVCNLHFGLQ